MVADTPASFLEPPPAPAEVAQVEAWVREAWENRLASRTYSQELSQKALDLARSTGYLQGEGYALRNLGFCQYQASNFTEALPLLSEGLQIAQVLNDAGLERDCLNYIGAIYAGLGELERALEYVERTYRLNQRIGDQSGIAASLNNIGIVYKQMGREEDSVRAKLEGIELARALQDQPREAFILCNLASSYIPLGRLQEAVQVSYQALELCQALNLKDLEAKVRVNLAEALAQQGDHAKALTLLDWVLEHAQNTGLKEPLIHYWINVATLHASQGSHTQALPALQQALLETQALGAKDLELQVHQRLWETHKALGNFERALQHHEAYHQLETTVRAESVERRLKVFGITRDLEKARAEAEIERLKNVELARALEALHQANLEKSALVQALEEQVIRDPLTRLYNRRHLEATLAREYAQAQHSQQPLAVAIVDVDNFKHVNDRFSHLIGDLVLQKVAEIMSQNARESDFLARYGGEEFVLVLPQSNLETARPVCEQLRLAVAAYDWSTIHPELQVTISLGLAADPHLPNHEKLLDSADARLYEAKHSGKNCLRY
ncbi:tetratricopeptide repeat-containing diguanylate cyclase [Meiothermus granaticius]|uniref:Diguanylate cyclase DosC n=1 Tax=Meiothermus granaticius NBRC 107808 TaxID=1227551 RepID=A0A399FB15_9DEIN|nr:tetratricopeptide repeat-containing diguanylate cyclase [Meiothermus granaticius]RIH91851.1 Diguanylate cyclase DosC [Meiothermus granaticius NBRC 107808]GEM87518.1 hypothetical protein MGR01S_21430 [Meiothermus granaticius NBRC 107808]